MRPELSGVPGVPETALTDALLARLPDDAPPSPWAVRLGGVVWLDRGGRAAREALPAPLRTRRAWVCGAAVRYSETPVGAYDEVLGVVGTRDGLRPVGTVAFMAVDSEASVVGGRTNWALPKTLATFDGAPASGRTLTAAGVGGSRWRVSVAARAFGPRLPVAARPVVRQVFPGARVADSRLRGRGWLRLAVVTVEVESEGALSRWLRPGRHLGAVVEPGSFTLSDPSYR